MESVAQATEETEGRCVCVPAMTNHTNAAKLTTPAVAGSDRRRVVTVDFKLATWARALKRQSVKQWQGEHYSLKTSRHILWEALYRPQRSQHTERPNSFCCAEIRASPGLRGIQSGIER